MISKCSNGKPFIITNRAAVQAELASGWVPSVVLLTAWTPSSASISFWEVAIKTLLNKGTTYFVCVGAYSEKLHDEIDELLYQYDDDRGTKESVNIVTTYHANETVEEAVDYCVYSTELRDKDNGCILAILDDDSIEDREIKEFLEKA